MKAKKLLALLMSLVLLLGALAVPALAADDGRPATAPRPARPKPHLTLHPTLHPTLPRQRRKRIRRSWNSSTRPAKSTTATPSSPR